MKRTTLAAAVVAVIGFVTTGSSRGAPGPKPRDEAPGPITAEQLQTSDNNLKQIVLGYHNYNDTFGFLPTNQLSKDKKPLLSWRVQILPYIEQDNLYKQFKLDEPWDSAHNKPLAAIIPKTLRSPRQADTLK